MENDKTYFFVDDLKLTIRITDRAVFDYQNLFNGDQLLSQNMHNVANSNWNVIMDDTIESVEYAYGLVAAEIVKTLFNVIPLESIFLS